MEKDKRPLSPHLQIYKPQFTSVMSILHRFTGILSIFGLIFISIWLVYTASGESGWQSIDHFTGNFLIAILFCLWVLTLIYHLCNGIRHLVWDAGKCLEIDQAKKAARIVQIATLLIWLFFIIALWV